MSIRGELVDKWTINDPQECGRVGEGTLTVKFRTSPQRVIPFIDRFQRQGKGSWIIGVPVGKIGVTAAPYSKATGTITRVDNTTRRPMEDGTPCPGADKPGCGTSTLRKPKSQVRGHDRRRVAVLLASERFEFLSEFSCWTGGLSGWSTPRVSGGTPEGHLLVKMPKLSVLKRRRTVAVKDTGRETNTFTDRLNPGSETTTEDVTRKVTVTFKRR